MKQGTDYKGMGVTYETQGQEPSGPQERLEWGI